MWIQLINNKYGETVLNLKKLADEKEFLLDITVGVVQVSLMEEIGVIRTSINLINELDKMRKAYEELLKIKWAYDRLIMMLMCLIILLINLPKKFLMEKINNV